MSFALPYHGERLRGDALARRLDAGRPPGSSNRLAPTRSGRLRLIRSGSACPGGRWPCSALEPRSARCRSCSAGVPGGRDRPATSSTLGPGPAHGAGCGGPRSCRSRRSGPRTVRPGDATCGAGRPRPGRRRPRSRWTGWRARRPAGAGQLRLRRRRGERAVSAAVDALTLRLQAARDDLALAFLATPTDVFAVSGDAVASRRAPTRPGHVAPKLVQRPLLDAVGAGGCCAAPTCPAPIPASATAWLPSRGPTTPWRNACNGGGPHSPATAGQRCR